MLAINMKQQKKHKLRLGSRRVNRQRIWYNRCRNFTSRFKRYFAASYCMIDVVRVVARRWIVKIAAHYRVTLCRLALQNVAATAFTKILSLVTRSLTEHNDKNSKKN